MSTQTHYHPGKDGYVSEFTQFIESLLAHHPDIIEDQRIGWKIHWDHDVNLQELEKNRQDIVPIDDHLGTISQED